MPNGKPPKTTGEHLVSLYGYVQGFKRQIDHLHQDVGKLERKTDVVIYWIVGGAFTTILTLVGLFTLFMNYNIKPNYSFCFLHFAWRCIMRNKFWCYNDITFFYRWFE